MTDTSPNDHEYEGGLWPDAAGQWYIAPWHFDERMKSAAKQLLVRHGTFLERSGYWLTIVAIVGAMIAAGVWIPFFPFNIFVLLFAIWGVWFGTRTRRMIRRIASERLCLRCGYPLLKSPVDDVGWGRCPECARRFNIGEYRRPPKGYQRIHPALIGDTQRHAGDSEPTYLP